MDNTYKCKGCGNTLELIVKTEEENVFTINKNGEIEFLNNRSVTQTLYLECEECGKIFKFDNDLLIVEKRPVLRLENINSYKTNPISKSDLY